MSTSIATVSLSSSFSITRTSKAGKKSTRNLLGLIIEGTPAERLDTGILLAKEGWENGNYKIVLDTLGRIFAGSNWTASLIYTKLDVNNPNRDGMLLLLDGIARSFSDAKGIKAKYVKLCTQLVEWSKDEAARKEARRLAYETAKALDELKALEAANTVNAAA